MAKASLSRLHASLAEVAGNQYNNGTWNMGDHNTISFVNPTKDQINDACIQALFTTKPDSDRSKIIHAKGEPKRELCAWFLEHPRYIAWRDSTPSSNLLWVFGAPGFGKTMLSVFLSSEHAPSRHRREKHINLYYFCAHNEDKRNTASSVLRGLIWSLLRARPKLKRILVEDYSLQKESLFTEAGLEDLWGTFEAIVRDPQCGEVRCVIDGLDQCAPEGLGKLLSLIKYFFHQEQTASVPTTETLHSNPPAFGRPSGNSPLDYGGHGPRTSPASPFPGGKGTAKVRLILVSREQPDCLQKELTGFPSIRYGRRVAGVTTSLTDTGLQASLGVSVGVTRQGPPLNSPSYFSEQHLAHQQPSAVTTPHSQAPVGGQNVVPAQAPETAAVSQAGPPAGQISTPTGQISTPAGQNGTPAGQIGHPAGQVGHPAGQVGHPASQVGHPASQISYTPSQVGHPATPAGIPEIQVVHPTGPAGVPENQVGHPAGPAGVPEIQVGHPASPAGHPISQPGYPVSHAGHTEMPQPVIPGRFPDTATSSVPSSIPSKIVEASHDLDQNELIEAYYYDQALQSYANARAWEICQELRYDEKATALLASALVDRGDGSYLWIDLAAHHIQLAGMGNLSHVLNTLPGTVQGLYRSVLYHIPPHLAQTAATLLQWVVSAKEPLDISQLAVALGLSASPSTPGVPAQLLTDAVQACSSFLSVDEQWTISVSHASAKDFLTTRSPAEGVYGDPDLYRYHVDTEGFDATIYQTCINYLEAGCFLEGPIDTRDTSSVKWQQAHARFPFFEYATWHWWKHLKSARAVNIYLDSRFFAHGSSIRKNWWITMWCSMHAANMKLAPRDFTLLHLAAVFDLVRLTEAMIAAGQMTKRLNARDSHSNTPLEYAIRFGNLDMVKLLIARGARFSPRPGFDTVLELASMSGHLEVVRYLLEIGVCVDERAPDSTKTQLAAIWGRFPQGFIYQCSTLDGFNDFGDMFPVHYAAAHGHLDVLELLLSRTQHPGMVTSTSWTALHCAAFNGQEDCCHLLLQRGSDIRAMNKKWWTPLHCAASRGHLQIVILFLEQNAYHDALNQKNKTPLHLAAYYGHVETINLLTSRGSNPNVRSHRGETALHLAVRGRHPAAVEALLMVGADRFVQDNDGQDARQRAQSNNSDQSREIVRVFDTIHTQGYETVAQREARMSPVQSNFTGSTNQSYSNLHAGLDVDPSDSASMSGDSHGVSGSRSLEDQLSGLNINERNGPSEFRPQYTGKSFRSVSEPTIIVDAPPPYESPPLPARPQGSPFTPANSAAHSMGQTDTYPAEKPPPLPSRPTSAAPARADSVSSSQSTAPPTIQIPPENGPTATPRWSQPTSPASVLLTPDSTAHGPPDGRPQPQHAYSYGPPAAMNTYPLAPYSQPGQHHTQYPPSPIATPPSPVPPYVSYQPPTPYGYTNPATPMYGQPHYPPGGYMPPPQGGYTPGPTYFAPPPPQEIRKKKSFISRILE